MKASCLSLWVLPLAGLALAAPAFAQYPAGGVPGFSPRVSPYINLLRTQGARGTVGTVTTGTPAAVNYYGIVRPEFQLGASVNTLATQTLANRQAIGDLQAGTGALTTGHPVGFLNHMAYFQNLGGPGGGTGFSTGLGGQVRPANAATTPAASRGGGRGR